MPSGTANTSVMTLATRTSDEGVHRVAPQLERVDEAKPSEGEDGRRAVPRSHQASTREDAREQQRLGARWRTAFDAVVHALTTVVMKSKSQLRWSRQPVDGVVDPVAELDPRHR